MDTKQNIKSVKKRTLLVYFVQDCKSIKEALLVYFVRDYKPVRIAQNESKIKLYYNIQSWTKITSKVYVA
jgi:hypothetical protein